MKPKDRLHLLKIELEHYIAISQSDKMSKEKIQAFLESTKRPFSRETREGHITVSAIVLDSSLNNMLFIWHEQLHRWLQPGGHCEEGEETMNIAALRELCEETGLPPAKFHEIGKGIFDVDVHEIPGNSKIEKHLHLDIRYIYSYSGGDKELIITHKWVGIQELANHPEDSFRRIAEKIHNKE